jgi:hypothetical protein
MIGKPVPAALALAVGVVLTSCSSSSPPPRRTVTVTVPASTPARSTQSDPAPTTSSAAPTSSATAHLSKLPGTCDTLLPQYAVTQAIGGAELTGTTAFVVGQPEPDIGRIAYLNCRYGVTGTGDKATPSIEVGISLYQSAAKAAARIPATRDDYTAHGAQATETTVKGHPGVVLSGGVGDGYDVPLLVVAAGQRTVAVSVASSVATGEKAISDASALAALALERTGG